MASLEEFNVGWDQRACERRPTIIESQALVGRRSQARWSHPTVSFLKT